MNRSSEFIVSEKVLIPMVQEMLTLGKSVRFTVSGNSMWPLIIHNRDSVLLVSSKGQTLKKGDIILFEAMPEHYVLHRIIGIKKSGSNIIGYITVGDGNLEKDPFVPAETVFAKVLEIYRKGKIIKCSSFFWKFVFQIWICLFPIRRYVFCILKRLIAKI